MPFAYAGRCYETEGDVLVAFRESFPKWGDVHVTTHVSSSVNVSGVLSYSVQTRPITSNTVSTRTGSFQLVTCVDVEPVFDPVQAGGIFVFFFVGVASTWYISENIGLILQAIKKW